MQCPKCPKTLLITQTINPTAAPAQSPTCGNCGVFIHSLINSKKCSKCIINFTKAIFIYVKIAKFATRTTNFSSATT